MRKITKRSKRPLLADYDAQSAVERELVLRLASLLWRLRRATTMETGLFEIQADHLREFRQGRQTQTKSREIIYAWSGWANSVDADSRSRIARHHKRNGSPAQLWAETPLIPPPTSHVAFCVWPICPATRSTGLAGMKQSLAPGRPDPDCSRCIGSSQTTRQRAPFPYRSPARPAGRRAPRLLRCNPTHLRDRRRARPG